MADYKKNTSQKGRTGEWYASTFLRSRGFDIVTANFHSAFGELDIIAQKNKELYFCEVKTRWSVKFGLPQEAVTKTKLEKIKRTIDYYLYKNNIKNKKMHIIVISQIIQKGKLILQKIIPVN